MTGHKIRERGGGGGAGSFCWAEANTYFLLTSNKLFRIAKKNTIHISNVNYTGVSNIY